MAHANLSYNTVIFDDDQFEIDPNANDEENELTKQTSINKKKKPKKKKSKKKTKSNGHVANHVSSDEENNEEKVEIEFIPEEIVLDKKDPNYSEFFKVFEHFKINENVKVDEKSKESLLNGLDKSKDLERLKYKIMADDDEEEKLKKDENLDESGKPKLSKKKLKKETRLSVAELKQLVNRPDVVEMHDVTARDPKLLVHLKATRNTVPVPRHWCAKRKYLQGKRGIEKPAFDLPDFIKRTGITEMRQALHEKEDNKSLKQKMREKVRPKMGKIDIDYQKLHDAFFRYQTKPRMSIHGDLYYEGKEFETKLKEKKPGNLTDDLKISLGMPIGTSSDRVPPPWLIAMQRYGPPPSYPNLKIPGLNAPIPEGCSFGYHAGGWGKPPVDEFGRPLYGDVFGPSTSDNRKSEEEENIDRTYWGELEEEEIEDILPEQESSEEEIEKEDLIPYSAETTTATSSGIKTPGEGLMTPSGISTTVSAGVETPAIIELRKNKIESDMEGSETPALFKLLPEKPIPVGSSMMGSTKVYDISAAKKVSTSEQSSSISGIDVTLNPDELDLSSEVIQARYNQQMKEQHTVGGGADKEDLSDMVADHAAKQSKKRKTKQQVAQSSTQDKAKKVKEFKF